MSVCQRSNSRKRTQEFFDAIYAKLWLFYSIFTSPLKIHTDKTLEYQWTCKTTFLYITSISEIVACWSLIGKIYTLELYNLFRADLFLSFAKTIPHMIHDLKIFRVSVFIWFWFQTHRCLVKFLFFWRPNILN